MRFLTNASFTALSVGGLLAGLGLLPSSGRDLHASDEGWVPLLDTDGDGLDDALEVRLGTAVDLADTDGDGYTDTEEMVLGADPLVAQDTIAAAAPALYVDAYALGNELYVQTFLLSRSYVIGLASFWVLHDRTMTVPSGQLRRYQVETGLAPAPNTPQWRLRSVTYRLPRSAFESAGESSLAYRAITDDMLVTDQIPFTMVDGILVQLRPMSLYTGDNNVGIGSLVTGGSAHLNQGGGGGEPGGGTGGLFPLEPGEGSIGENRPDQVCYQVLVPIANLGGGRVLYQVVDASCESMAGAICFATCSATVGDQYVLLDVVGLLGG
ncbi:MAG: hypothetical protein EYC70_08725 [Planctomycetota bacterium]|nr:MAG: hypothetical protein EYC70_08725 [Planctomycetota bacterium]